jgi:hypothetical protein
MSVCVCRSLLALPYLTLLGLCAPHQPRACTSTFRCGVPAIGAPAAGAQPYRPQSAVGLSCRRPFLPRAPACVAACVAPGKQSVLPLLLLLPLLSDQSRLGHLLSLLPPRSFRRYLHDFREINVLGRGGFGEVIKTQNHVDGQFYAIKKVKLKGSAEEQDAVIRSVQSI